MKQECKNNELENNCISRVIDYRIDYLHCHVHDISWNTIEIGEFEVLSDLKVFWKGRVPLSKVEWNFSSNNEHFLPENLEAKKENVWAEMVAKFPEVYDGDILILEDFRITNDKMVFDLGLMKFSRVLTLEKEKQSPSGYGTLGMQAIVFSHDGQNVLAGSREESHTYCPTFHAVPGGILEVIDTKGSFESACMREFNEEVNLLLQHDKYLVGIIQEFHGTVGVVALIATTPLEQVDPEKDVSGNNEWNHHKLSWYPVDQLENVTFENSLEGLLFLKNERNQFITTGRSVLW